MSKSEHFGPNFFPLLVGGRNVVLIAVKPVIQAAIMKGDAQFFARGIRFPLTVANEIFAF